ncbi:hypothetical protein CEE37_12745 [candidate division LCP-89 bacterium B3_LCP]|uniref:Uncharacterized protein n=1 Tax=candidate division LCP-89 bacterium B3_LCP TaxID=2012998 RepID=A0A532UU42_UNCL8|nr:MAG: hypothetical protein CEE37_12745 [candidate division LCP-89 bacterium B3_LCP]
MKTGSLKDPALLGWLIPLLVSGIVFASTMCRTVYIGDSGEFSLVFKTLGIAHPPGYPLFTLLGNLFVLLTGFLKPALSANLLSMLLSLTVLPILFFLFKGRQNPTPASLIALLWSFTPSFWAESVGVEVYNLNVAFIAVITLLAFSDRSSKWLLIAYLLGLSLAHHLTAIILLPAIIYMFFKQDYKINVRVLPVSAILFVLGLSVYLYLPARASVSPLADWGHPSSLSLLINHITASQYQQAATFSLANLWASLVLFLSLMIENWWWLGIAATIFGAVVSYKYYFDRFIFALILISANIILAAFYRIPDIDPYYLPALFACLIYVGNGLIWLWGKLGGKQERAYFTVVLGGLVFLLLILNYGKVDRSDYRLAEDYGKLILDTAGSGTVFTKNDNSSFAALYLRYAEGYQPDVEVFDKAVRMKALVDRARSLTGRSLLDYQSARIAYLQKAPGQKYLTKSLFPYDLKWKNVGEDLTSRGILYAYNQPYTRATVPGLRHNIDAADFKSRQVLINLNLSRGDEYLSRDMPDTSRAEGAFGKALNYMEGEPRGSLHNQLGISFRHLGQGDLALTAYKRGLIAPRLSESERGEINFNISNIHKDRGNSLAAAGDYQGALTAFLKALEYDPVNARLFYNVGVIYTNFLNDPNRGIPYLKSYLKQNPSDDNVKNLIRSFSTDR